LFLSIINACRFAVSKQKFQSEKPAGDALVVFKC